jgi:hypothetical protein
MGRALHEQHLAAIDDTASRSRSLLLVESQNVVGGPPPLFQMLSAREQALVLSYGQRACDSGAFIAVLLPFTGPLAA